MNSAEIRKKFLDYFASQGHAVVSSSSLVPANDPTLLFTNSGMVQFKDIFLGQEKRPYTRATTAQRCVRAGGKHNDLENVGYTARHHTFFEMLGNFSFGDYFKRDAIRYAWELLTKVYGFPPEKLWITVYQEDDEAHAIWANEIGVPTDRIIRIGDNKGARYASDNFWQMADTGPCGPCSEIFYDHGPGIPGGPPGSPDAEGDRYIEIWNLVFMQFNRDETGTMHPLPKPCVDTGMGLERLAAVLQHVHSNYEIDLLRRLVQAAQRETGAADDSSPSLRVIADHIRASAFLIVDGVIPSNDGRGYVLRRIIRRALRHGHKLGQTQPFFHKLVPDLAAEMGDAYPELRAAADRVADTLRQEEIRFGETLEHGMAILETALVQTPQRLDGETAFKLYDTYGFPLDLTADICRERDIVIDEAGFDRAMERQREQARKHSQFAARGVFDYDGPATNFHGYEELATDGRIVALYRDGTRVDELNAGESGGSDVVVLDHTPFYAESGGQVGDRGRLESKQDDTASFRVDDTQKIQADVFGHHGTLERGRLRVGDAVKACVDTEARARTVRNHSATHLMHKALREVLGPHVQQKGSLVDAERTRFDFAHNAPLTTDEIRRIETLVNAEILANQDSRARLMSMDEAQKSGAMALFGEKYGDVVRVVDIGDSRELCGGTHVGRSGDIGLFKIVSESGVAAGVRRVEAITGDNALSYVQRLEADRDFVSGFFGTTTENLRDKIEKERERTRALEKELDRLKAKLAGSQSEGLIDAAVAVKDARVLAARLEGADAKTLRETMDRLKDKLKSAVIVLASVEGEKISLIAGVTPDLTARAKAGELVNFVAQKVGGKGGGRPDMAMAGGTQPQHLEAALKAVPEWAAERL